ncbi:MAG: AraC family transcriptional regulator ligand-binding domain-containing protein, partial [Myxococcota bacterium]
MAANYGYALDPSFKGLLASVGVRHEDVLRRAGLPDDLLNRSNVRLPREQFFAFAKAIEDLADDPRLPIRLAEGMSAEWFSPPAFAALCSPDLATAVQRLARFKPLVAPIELTWESDDTGLRVTFGWLECATAPPRFLSGAEALGLVRLARIGTRHDIRPVGVTMPDAPLDREAHEAFLGCAIRRDAVTSVTFAAAD